jgi:hypothetical protein
MCEPKLVVMCVNQNQTELVLSIVQTEVMLFGVESVVVVHS